MARSRRTRPAADPQGLLDALPLDGGQAANLRESGLLDLALTHRSYSYENDGVAHNERLEFLGDAVLQLAVTEQLYTAHPSLPEGDLARRRAGTVSSRALAVIATRLDLGRSEEHTSELQSRGHLVCRLLLEKKKTTDKNTLQTRT